MNKVTTYTINYKDNQFIGEARCHPEDMPFAQEQTGKDLARNRALIKYLQFVRENEVKPGLKALNQLYYSMSKSKKYNAKSYEAKMLNRQIAIKKEELQGIKESIQELAEANRFIISHFERTKHFLESKK